jgi:large subunit ribosomal protein L21
MAFAVIKTGGKQYRVAVGNKLKIEKLEADVDGKVVFGKVLLTVDGEKVNIGAPEVAGAKVEGKVLVQGRARKVIVFKYHSKTRRRKKNGHRQPFTEVEIVKIG